MGENIATDYSIKGYHKPDFVVRKRDSMNLGGGVASWVRDDIDFEVIKSPFIAVSHTHLTLPTIYSV